MRQGGNIQRLRKQRLRKSVDMCRSAQYEPHRKTMMFEIGFFPYTTIDATCIQTVQANIFACHLYTGYYLIFFLSPVYKYYFASLQVLLCKSTSTLLQIYHHGNQDSF